MSLSFAKFMAVAISAPILVAASSDVSSQAREVIDTIFKGGDVQALLITPDISPQNVALLAELAGCRGSVSGKPTVEKIEFLYPCKPKSLRGGPSRLEGILLILKFSRGVMVSLELVPLRSALQANG